MEDFVYVCLADRDMTTVPEKIFFSEDAARGWLRNEFLKLKEKTGLRNEDFEWGDYDFVWDGGQELRHVWEIYSFEDMDNIYMRAIKIPFEVGDSHEIYVCREETENGFSVDKLFIDLESAREWQRENFLKHRNSGSFKNEDYMWESDEKDGTWGCTYMYERASWDIFRLDLPE